MPHYRITSTTGCFYGCAWKEFNDTHIPILNHLEMFTKCAQVRAIQATEKTLVLTIMEDGKKEAQSEAPVGSWIVQNPGGEVYVVADTEFREKYYEALTSAMKS